MRAFTGKKTWRETDTSNSYQLVAISPLEAIGMELSSQQHDQLAEFLEVWASPAAAETSVDVGPHLTCVEVDALARLMRTCGRDEEADMWLVSHSMEDGTGEAHYTLNDRTDNRTSAL